MAFTVFGRNPESPQQPAAHLPLSPRPPKAGLVTTPPQLPPQKNVPALESEKSAQRSRAVSSTDRRGSRAKARGKTELPICLLPLGTHPHPALYRPRPRLRSLVNEMQLCPRYQHTDGYQQHLGLLQHQHSGPCCAETGTCVDAARACTENLSSVNTRA